jgi:beta-lactamase class A
MGRVTTVFLLCCFWLSAGCDKPAPSSPAASPRADGGPELLRQKARQLLAGMQAPKADELAILFSEPFLRDVAPRQVQHTFENYRQTLGKPRAVRLVQVLGPLAAELEFEFAAARLTATMDLEAAPPHRILGLVFRQAKSDADTLDSLLDEIKGLHGQTSLALRRLEPEPMTLLEWNPQLPLAIGSSFKLFLLAALTRDVAQGQCRWDQLIRLRREWLSYPSGTLQDWPVGSPLTLHSLAAMMLTQSDNTAADHLLFTLGRERVEAALPELGVAAAARNRPLLATHEIFKLKLNLPAAVLEAYARADEAGRRKLLADPVAKTPLGEPRLLTRPLEIERVEWFASAVDLVRVLDWFRRPEWEEGRRLLGILPPFRVDEERWPYVGFKAGSECGVINFCLLLQSRRGPWFALAVTWNDPQRDVDAAELLRLVERMVRTLQKREETGD